MTTTPWILAVAALGALVVVLSAVLLAGTSGRRRRPAPLPSEWALAPRPVFSTDERRMHRLLREALPQYIVLAKLPLIRFCQPIDPKRVRYWYELLGVNHVAFAICSANGRVLAAIDIDKGRDDTSRTQLIKQAVLNALRVRYLRCPVDQLPSPAELQMLVPQAPARPAGPVAPQARHDARTTLASTVASRRAQRSALWQDSAQFPDSFFAPDTRSDGFGSTEQGGLYGRSGPTSRFDSAGAGTLGDAEIAGVVVDTSRTLAASRQ
jgi:hypothetical protein